jgi:hypothetical protein
MSLRRAARGLSLVAGAFAADPRVGIESHIWRRRLCGIDWSGVGSIQNVEYSVSQPEGRSPSAVKNSEAADFTSESTVFQISQSQETAYVWAVSLQFQFVVFLSGEA